MGFPDKREILAGGLLVFLVASLVFSLSFDVFRKFDVANSDINSLEATEIKGEHNLTISEISSCDPDRNSIDNKCRFQVEFYFPFGSGELVEETDPNKYSCDVSRIC
jgi:hypothetical protein